MDPARPLAGLVFVLTGTFKLTHAVLSGMMRVQGDVQLDEGKGAVAEAITSRGGTVRGSVSKWTHVLVVGDQPGSTKVLRARQSNATVLLLARPFLDAIQRGAVPAAIEAAKIDPPLEIGQFSLGRSFGGGAVGGLVAPCDAKVLADRTVDAVRSLVAARHVDVSTSTALDAVGGLVAPCDVNELADRTVDAVGSLVTAQHVDVFA